MCGKCCRNIGLPWPGNRIYEIAEFLKITPEEFVIKYLGKIIEKDGRKDIERYEIDQNKDCPFLSSDNSCLIYKVRPDGCRSYPVDTDLGRGNVDCQGFD